MMLALLLTATAIVVLLPMLPAIAEWHRPSDVVPLHIDTHDALDPPYLARSFAAQLADAVASRRSRLGSSHIARAPANSDWPLTETERRQAASRRVWHAVGGTELPPGIHMLAEVAAPGHLRTATGVVHRALWAGRSLQLAPNGTVLRWAHGAQVDVAAGCRLAGRVSADERLTLWGHASFTLLHAPTIRFAAADTAVRPPGPRPALVALGLQAPVVWDLLGDRGTCTEPLRVEPHRVWRGDLVCHDDLQLGAGCHAHGSLKVRGNLLADAGCRIGGNVVGEGCIELSAGCAVRGSVISESAITLGQGCVIGLPGHPATVAAPRIDVSPGVVVHGTLWATEAGQTVADAQWRATHDQPSADAAPAPLRGAAS